MRRFSQILRCALMAVVLIAAVDAMAQTTSDDNSDRLAAPFDPDNTPSIRHTPSGQLYFSPPPAQPDKTFSGSIEIGATATTGDVNNAKFREYRDPHSGPAINNFDFSVGQ